MASPADVGVGSVFEVLEAGTLVFAAPDSDAVLRTLDAGSYVVASGPAVDVGGFLMVPLRPDGAVELDCLMPASRSKAPAAAGGCGVAAAVASPGAPLARQLRELTDEEVDQLPQRATISLTRPSFAKACVLDRPGAFYGLLFPHSIEQLGSAEYGPEWLTGALHAAGTLPATNAVQALEVVALSTDPTAMEGLGGASVKALLKVSYAHNADGLHRNLFCKLPLPYEPHNERYKMSVQMQLNEWPEIAFNRFMSASVPFLVPKYYFGDISAETTNFILISEALSFPSKDLQQEPPPLALCAPSLKYRDHELPRNGVDRYFCLTRALAAFTAKYQGGALGDRRRLAKVFQGLEPTLAGHEGSARWSEDPAAWSPELARHCEAANTREGQLAEMFMEVGLDFVRHVAPQLYPERLRERSFLERFHRQALTCLQYRAQLSLFCDRLPELQSLTHVNSQIDNAFFWHTGGGGMDCGIFDWAGVRGAAFLEALGSNWNSAMPEMLEEHEEGLVRCWVGSYHEAGGSARLTLELVYEIIQLHRCTGWVGRFSNVKHLLQQIPKHDARWPQMDRWGPEVNGNYVRRAFVAGVGNVLETWLSPKRNPADTFDRWLARYSALLPARKPTASLPWKT